MPRDANGNYTSPANTWNVAVEGTTIDESDWNEFRDDVETGLTDSVARDGSGTIQRFDFDENGSPGTPSSNVGRLYAADVGSVTSLFFKDSAGNARNLLLPGAAMPYVFNASTDTASDPGANNIAFNHLTLGSVTEIAIDDLNAHGADVSGWIATWDDVSGTLRGHVIIQDRNDGSNFVIAQITGASTDESGWTRLAVTVSSSGGSLSGSVPLDVFFGYAGPAGATGPTGATGPAGADGADGADGTDGASNIFVQASEPGSANDGDLWIDSDDDGRVYKRVTGSFVDQGYTTKGDTGATGATGAAGAAGQGVPAGGTASQVLAKIDGTDYNTQWVSGGGDLVSTNNLNDVANAATAATNLGLGTGDTPRFDGIHVGHASDTTITRTAAGTIAVEGDDVLMDSDIGSAVQAFDADILKADTSDDLTVGFTSTGHSGGTQSSGTYTPAPANGNLQYITNGGAFTLAAPTATGDYTMTILVTNNGSAGTITFSGFQVGSNVGDDLTTTNGDDFMIHITRINSIISYTIQALQ